MEGERVRAFLYSVRLGPKLQVDVGRVQIGLTAWRLDLQARLVSVCAGV